jgi:pimeloyl-ACP methyl ester carboxylesterase
MLPGLLCDDAVWRHQLRHLDDVADMRVADFTSGDSMAAFAQRVLDIAPSRFAMAALSMGGYVAFEVLRRASDRVLGLALVDTGSRSDSDEMKKQRRGLIELASMGKFKGVTPRLLPLLVHPDRLEDAQLTEEVIDMAGRVGPQAFVDQERAIMGRPDSRPDLAGVGCPSVVVCGRQDVLTPLSLSEEMAARIPSAKLVVVERSGHMSPMEQPEAVTAVLRYWLQLI